MIAIDGSIESCQAARANAEGRSQEIRGDTRVKTELCVDTYCRTQHDEEIVERVHVSAPNRCCTLLQCLKGGRNQKDRLNPEPCGFKSSATGDKGAERRLRKLGRIIALPTLLLPTFRSCSIIRYEGGTYMIAYRYTRKEMMGWAERRLPIRVGVPR